MIVGGAAIATALTAAYLVAPEKATEQQKKTFAGLNYAHRGLHKIDRSVVENSLPAFEAAAKIGYGVELDLQFTLDKQVVVFHDDNIKRMCGVDKKIQDMTYEQLCQYNLLNTSEKIPLFSEVLALVDGRSPLLVELKKSNRNREFCEEVMDLLDAYKGRFCIESFDPRIVYWFRKHAPDVLRGQLGSDPSKLNGETSRLNAFLIGNLFTNLFTRPHFVSYEKGHKPWSVKLCEKLGALKFVWTSTGWMDESDYDGVIFQYYRPRVTYK